MFTPQTHKSTDEGIGTVTSPGSIPGHACSVEVAWGRGANLGKCRSQNPSLSLVRFSGDQAPCRISKGQSEPTSPGLGAL